jgi:nitroreductase
VSKPPDSAFLRLCRLRRSVRNWDQRPVEREKLKVCLEAARLAPSAENSQPARFIVFDDQDKKAALGRVVFTGIYSASARFAQAPVLVCLLIRESLLVNRLGGRVQGTPFQYVDAGIAGEHFVLAAAEQGLGTCWIGWFNGRSLARYLGIGRRYRPVCLIAVGYPAPDSGPREPKRQALAEIVGWNVPPES